MFTVFRSVKYPVGLICRGAYTRGGGGFIGGEIRYVIKGKELTRETTLDEHSLKLKIKRLYNRERVIVVLFKGKNQFLVV